VQVLNSHIKDNDPEAIAEVAAGLALDSLMKYCCAAMKVAHVAQKVGRDPQVRHALQSLQRKFARNPQGAVWMGVTLVL